VEKLIRKNLPKGFRFLLTKKDIKEMEMLSGFPFGTVSFGHITDAEI
jgi:hypothetical protein